MQKLRLLLVVVCLFAAACKDDPINATAVELNPSEAKHETKKMAQEVSIKIGERAPDFQKRYPDQITIIKQPAGLDFYKIRWKSKPRGTVKIDHGAYSFAIEDVLSLSTTLDLELPEEGFADYSINAGMAEPSPGLIPHAQARDKIYALLKQIEARGWRSFTSEYEPRLTGQDRLNRVLTVNDWIGLDTKYIPTLDEWMKIESSTSWHFYADRQYLTVDFRRESSLTDPEKPGAYLLSFALKSEAQHYRTYVGPDNRARWQALLPTELATLKQNRAKTEAALKAQGIKIDETYQDPPLPAFMQ